jgi:hypothetical protein
MVSIADLLMNGRLPRLDGGGQGLWSLAGIRNSEQVLLPSLTGGRSPSDPWCARPWMGVSLGYKHLSWVRVMARHHGRVEG